MSTARAGQTHTLETAQKLGSWKSIANYFDCDQRTAKRWERERGLPIHRAPGGKRSAVFAYSSELESWLRTGIQKQGLRSRTTVPETNSEEGNALPLGIETGGVSEGQSALVSPRALTSRRWPIRIAAIAAVLLLAVLLSDRDRHAASLESSSFHALSGSVRHVPVAGAEDLYLQGRYFWSLRTADSLSKAIDAYTEAIVKDPSYAEAYAGLAETYDLLPQFAHDDLARAFTRAKGAADRSIELNPDLAAAHRAKAFALFFWDWDIPGSEAEFQRALALDPNSAETHQWYASTLLNRLEGAECLKQIDEALRLSPASAAIATDAAFMHEEFGDDPDGSFRRLQELEQTQPTLLTPSYFLMTIDFARGDYQEYMAELHRIASITRQPDDIAMANAATRGSALGGKAGILRETVVVQKKAFERGTEPGFRLGQTYLLLGRPEEALPYFKASLDEHFILLITMQDCEWSKKLSTDPDYAALFAQIRKRMHGWRTSHPHVVPVAFRLPQ